MRHRRCIETTQSLLSGLAPGPLSPPTITQFKPLNGTRPRSSSSGSTDKKRIRAFVCCKSRTRGRPTRRFSTLTPHQICDALAAALSFVRKEVAQSGRPLRQHLVSVPVGTLHHADNRFDVIVWNVFVKQVTHRVHEDHARLRPAKRLKKFLWNKAQIEALLVGMPRDASKPFGKCLRIAMSATGADFGAAPNGIPRGVGPLDFGLCAHFSRE